jgi:hypothetical protein
MKRYLAAVRLRAESSGSDGSHSRTWMEEKEGSSCSSEENSRESGLGTSDFDQALRRGRIEHSEMTKFQVLGEREICDGKRTCFHRKKRSLANRML